MLAAGVLFASWLSRIREGSVLVTVTVALGLGESTLLGSTMSGCYGCIFSH